MPETKAVVIPEEVFERLRAGLGTWFSKLNGVEPDVLVRDMLNPAKSERGYEIMRRFVDPHGKKILEVGSGYGINLIYWSNHYGLDVTGVVPEGEGFSNTILVSRQLCELNQVSSEKIVVSPGEHLPFPDHSFDVVYSANAIEHTHDPVQVLRESLRVLRPGGVLHFEMPNFASFFEGHYLVVMPPLLHSAILPWWVKTFFRRDPGFARTLRTEINPVWLRRTIHALDGGARLRIVSLGEEVFSERLNAPAFGFQHAAVGSVLAPVINFLRKLNVGNIAANLLITLKAHYPIYLTVKKEAV